MLSEKFEQPHCGYDIASELARAEFLVDVDNMKNGISFFQELIAIMSAKAPLLLDVRFPLLCLFDLIIIYTS